MCGVTHLQTFVKTPKFLTALFVFIKSTAVLLDKYHDMTQLSALVARRDTCRSL